jgi:hypothetical protein
MISPNSSYIGYTSQTLIVTYDADGTPLLGRMLLSDTRGSPHLGQAAKVFTKQSDDTYTFYSEYGVKNASGVDDGGFFYSNDITRAGFIISGFSPLAAVGDTAQLTITDGPRCKEQYDYCAASATNNLDITANPAGTRPLYIKRIR